ncbi:hypothetical protein GALMADRAFT_144505 [Galerina marginata CBS 339.88]|uniref:Uncharacterized protein n=1 Tax=Galerina marginata (strain CBS 339.88) TaxID=685588 RepID=A0A067SSE6_GALM3|nr:hypothetical protein GALMADRAFT_144505 [Galerina marginata CBS 339.88]
MTQFLNPALNPSSGVQPATTIIAAPNPALEVQVANTVGATPPAQPIVVAGGGVQPAPTAATQNAAPDAIQFVTADPIAPNLAPTANIAAATPPVQPAVATAGVRQHGATADAFPGVEIRNWSSISPPRPSELHQPQGDWHSFYVVKVTDTLGVFHDLNLIPHPSRQREFVFSQFEDWFGALGCYMHIFHNGGLCLVEALNPQPLENARGPAVLYLHLHTPYGLHVGADTPVDSIWTPFGVYLKTSILMLKGGLHLELTGVHMESIWSLSGV